MNYVDFWKKNGLNYITPPGRDNPEGFDVGEILRSLIYDSVLEVGCGTGRIAKYFSPENYVGIDINQAAIDMAHGDLPEHRFKLHVIGDDYPSCKTALLYTVALHIPDCLIGQEMKRLSKSAEKIVIAEIMNTDYRKNRNKEATYDISNQRSIDQYCDIMRDNCGMKMKTLIKKPYLHYKDEFISFAEFIHDRKK